MSILSFENDYSEGAHPLLLQRLTETNLDQQPGYGGDEYTLSAVDKIRAACECPGAEVFFLSGGTQANRTVISALLHSTEGVVCADTGHIFCHEAGAVESTGHKVIPLPGQDGKLRAEDLEKSLRAFYADPTAAHMVYPGMVYISHPTEYGTLYTRPELEALSNVCRSYDIPLFLDGARLGYGLMSPGTDVTLPLIARLCAAFTVGGTKVGALCGEAVVFPGGAPKRFFTHVKQSGALLAKGRLMAVQFDALFTDGLYFEISRHAIQMAQKLKEGFLRRGYPMYLDSPTNQQFIVLENKEMESLARRVRFCFWEKKDETHSVVRFAVSWAATEEMIDHLMRILDEERTQQK